MRRRRSREVDAVELLRSEPGSPLRRWARRHGVTVTYGAMVVTIPADALEATQVEAGSNLLASAVEQGLDPAGAPVVFVVDATDPDFDEVIGTWFDDPDAAREAIREHPDASVLCAAMAIRTAR